MTETSYCPRHPDTPTKLRCSKCGTLVCPRCMVHSPVGVRCPKCGKPTRLPTYDVSVSHLARAILASLFLGVVGGLVAAMVVRPLLFGVLYMAAMAGFGYVVGEGASQAANRKRGRTIQLVAVGGTLVGDAIIAYFAIAFSGSLGPFDLFAWGLAAYVAFIRLR